jgi:site-specific recombinase XerD
MNIEESLELYYKHLKYEKNLAVNSINAYQKDLAQLADFLSKKQIDDTNLINLDLFREFLKFIDRYKYSNRTLIRKYSSYNNFFKFCELNGYIENQLSQFILPPKKQSRLYSFLSEPQVKALIEKMDSSGITGIRNRALLEFIYSTGARVSEVEGLKLKDLDLENSSAEVFGKGRKYRTVYLNRNAKEWLGKYLDVRSQFVYSKKNMSYQQAETDLKPGGDGHLFLNRFGKKLDARSFRNILAKSLLQAKVGRKISPHGLRHSFATHLLQEGAGIREIQELLGHENITTTQIYTHLNIKKLKEDFNKFHPRAGAKNNEGSD